jgi:hypothetical protein
LNPPPDTLGVMETNTVSLGELHDLLAEYRQGTTYPPGRRVQLSLACYSVVQDHHCAVAMLTDVGLYASAFTLARPVYEATVKGMWLQYCAPDLSLERFAAGKELPAVGEMTDALQKSKLPDTTATQLSMVKAKYWPALSSFAHAGHTQIRHLLSPDGVAPNYPETAVRELLNFTAYMAVVASMERARLGNNQVAIASMSRHIPR